MKYFFLSIIFVSISLIGCKSNSDAPCRSAHIFVQDFGPIIKSNLPFVGLGDTLKYINTNGDSIWCIGSNRLLYYLTFAVKNNPDCVDDSIGFTILQFAYADTLSKFTFTVKATHYDSLLTIIANNSEFHLPLLKIGVNDSVSWFDSLHFGNRVFFNINTYKNSNGDSLYYSARYGMIALKQASQRFYIYSFNKY
jgi:hypothetical protein